MNKIKKYVIGVSAAALVFGMPACNVLDVDPTGSYSEADVYSSIQNVDFYVKDFYRVLQTNADIATTLDDGVSDLVKFTWYTAQQNAMFVNTNTISPSGNFRSNWNGMYEFVRIFNDYFYDLSKGRAVHLNADQLKMRTAEVRFMRAFAYQELMIRHADGNLGVVLRTDEDHIDGPEERAKARSTEEECWDFILGEYDKAFADLPASWPAADLGRVTKGTAMGMKARAALYAGRWQDAIDACDDVLNPEVVGFTYALQAGTTYADYYKIFTTPTSSELILPVYYQQGISMKMHNFDVRYCPPGDRAAWPGLAAIGAEATPTDEYASSFDIKVGDTWQAFDWDNLGSYTAGPWAGREPRFYASILYNGATWKGRQLQLYAAAPANSDGYMDYSSVSGQETTRKTTTGYIFRKFMTDNNSINFTTVLSGQYWIEMRLAEIYLIRSEANARLNQFGPAYDDLKVIRDRVGLPELSRQNTWETYLVDLSKERVCELGLEGHRFFDLVRWGTIVETLNGKRMHAIKIAPAGTGFTYTRVECDTQDRIYPARYSIYPIPRPELLTNSLCEQSEVWK
jgi:hypothetical protein